MPGDVLNGKGICRPWLQSLVGILDPDAAKHVEVVLFDEFDDPTEHLHRVPAPSPTIGPGLAAEG